MVAQSEKIRYQRMGGSFMAWDFRQGIGGQSFLSSLGQGGWMRDRGIGYFPLWMFSGNG